MWVSKWIFTFIFMPFNSLICVVTMSTHCLYSQKKKTIFILGKCTIFHSRSGLLILRNDWDSWLYNETLIHSANISIWENIVLLAKTLDVSWLSSHLTLSFFLPKSLDKYCCNNMRHNFEKKEKTPCQFLCFPPICVHFILPTYNHLACLCFLLLNLLLINFKPSGIYSYLGHILPCVNPKCILQAPKAMVCCRQDPVSFLSVRPAPSMAPDTKEALSPCLWMNKNMYSYVGREGVVCVCLDNAHTQSYGMQIRMFLSQH